MRLRALVIAVAAVGMFLVPAVTAAPPAAASLNCPSAQDGFWENANTQLDHWYSAGGYFTGPTSGHQVLCLLKVQVGTTQMYQMVIVGGTASGDCVTWVSGGQGAGVDARGCVLGQGNELWNPIWEGSGYDWQNQAPAGLCLNVGTAPGDPWGVATCQANNFQQTITWHSTPGG